MKVTTTIDSWAWMEYFAGSDKGLVLGRLLEDPTEQVNTPTFVLLEIKSKYLKEKKQNVQSRLDFIAQRSVIVPLTTEIALIAAEFKAKGTLHTSDAIIYATAQWANSELLTGDPHFQGLNGVRMLD